MNIKMSDLLNMNQAIQNLAEKKIPIKGAFKLSKLEDEIRQGLTFYTEKLNQLIQDYAKKDEHGMPMMDESGNNIIIQEDKIEECRVKMAELNSIEVDIKDDLVITLSDLGNIECSVQELQGLSPVLREE